MASKIKITDLKSLHLAKEEQALIARENELLLRSDVRQLKSKAASGAILRLATKFLTKNAGTIQIALLTEGVSKLIETTVNKFSKNHKNHRGTSFLYRLLRDVAVSGFLKYLPDLVPGRFSKQEKIDSEPGTKINP